MLGSWVEQQAAETTTVGAGRNKSSRPKHTSQHILGLEGLSGPLAIDLGGVGRFGEVFVGE